MPAEPCHKSKITNLKSKINEIIDKTQRFKEKPAGGSKGGLQNSGERGNI
jgi:hypothetical protein